MSLMLNSSNVFAWETTWTVNTWVDTGVDWTIVIAPTFTPAWWSYSSSQSVSIMAEWAPYICYSSDWSSPSCDWTNLTCSSWAEYSWAVTVSSAKTLKAVSCYQWWDISWISSASYTFYTPSSWWGWGWGWGWWGWGWGWSVCYWDRILGADAKSDFTTCDNILLKEITSWVVPVKIKQKDSWDKYFFETQRDEKVTGKNGDIFLWKLLAPKRVSNTGIPKHDWKFVSLRALRIWAGDGSILTFKKWGKLTFSYAWISSTIDPKDIRIYSYDEEVWEYVLQDSNRIVNEDDKTILVDVFTVHNDFILTNWLLSWVSVQTWWSDEIFKAFFRDSWMHWARDYIEKLYNMWVIDKRERFFPDTPINRAEFVKMTMESFDFWFATDTNTPFSDVSSNAWYAKYVAKAEEMWIVDWYPDWTFWPARQINRAEAVKIVLEAAKISFANAWNSSFPDVPNYAWFAKYVAKANELWIVKWYSNWNFWPADNVTRWQVAKILIKALEEIE